MYQHHIGVNTPFFKSQKYNGFPPTQCLPLSREDFDKVLEFGDDTEIIFHIDLISLRIKETRKITVGKVKKLLENGAAKENNLSIGKVINLNRINCELI